MTSERERPSPEWLKHQTQVLLVVEVPEETHTVEFIIRVCVIQLLQELKLFKACLLPIRRKYFLNEYSFIFEGLKDDLTIMLNFY